MKNYKKPSTSKLVASFDSELKNILMADLAVYRTKTQFLNTNKQLATQSTLVAA